MLFSFPELVGYTARWVWEVDCPLWQTALDHHYKHNPHHPQFWQGADMEQAYLEVNSVWQ